MIIISCTILNELTLLAVAHRTRKDRQHQYSSFGQTGAYLGTHGLDAVGNFFSSIAIGVISANHQDGQLWIDSVDLAVLQAP